MVQPVLIDLDETVYPFIETWDRWLRKNGEGSVNMDVFSWWYDLDLFLSDHVERQPDFIAAQKQLKAKPIPEALANIKRIAQFYPLIALTARNKEDWFHETSFWVDKHIPFIEEIHYVRDKRGSEAVAKHVIADSLDALALIDDTKHWIDSLPEHILGFVVERPAPLASDAGARSWDEIAEELVLLHPHSAN